MFLFGRLPYGQAHHKLGLAFILCAAAAMGGSPIVSTAGGDQTTVSLEGLPAQAQVTESRIRSGGPFPYVKDGAVFGNRERLLPGQQRGYYREYTVKTPGTAGRGARRIVCGGEQPTRPVACFYSDDHYASFRRIVH